MTEKRFTMEKSEGQDTIYDWEGPDDYYHLGNDTRDVKDLCELLNEQDKQIKELERIIGHDYEERKRIVNNYVDLIEEKEERILELVEENEQLKQLVDEAEDIIICQCTTHYQRKWEHIKKNIKGDSDD